MSKVSSLKDFLEVYETTGDNFFIWGEQGDPHSILSSSCVSFKPNNTNEFLTEFFDREKNSLCSLLDDDYDEKDSQYYANEDPYCVYIDKNQPELGICEIYDFIPGGDSLLEYPSMNSISTYTRNCVSYLYEDFDLSPPDITLEIINEHTDGLSLEERERFINGLNPLNKAPESLLEVINHSSTMPSTLIEFNSIIFDETFGFGGVLSYFLHNPKVLTCSTLMGATKHANTPQSDKTYIGINKESGLVEYVRIPFTLTN